jgi:hypothetical protein
MNSGKLALPLAFLLALDNKVLTLAISDFCFSTEIPLSGL